MQVEIEAEQIIDGLKADNERLRAEVLQLIEIVRRVRAGEVKITTTGKIIWKKLN